jgi:hypothetical protein
MRPVWCCARIGARQEGDPKISRALVQHHPGALRGKSKWLLAETSEDAAGDRSSIRAPRSGGSAHLHASADQDFRAVDRTSSGITWY